MPTYDWLPQFMREYRRLSEADKDAFQAARRLLVAGLESGHFH